MCMRFLFLEPGRLEMLDRLHLQKIASYPSRYNIAPTQDVPVIFNDSKTSLSIARWGVTGWHEHLLFNARAETIDEKPAFRKLFMDRRCLMPASGFYEWEKSSKKPFKISLKEGKPFLFAAIYSEEETGRGACMITCDSNSLVGKIHNRMPVILPEGNELDFLEADIEEAKSMLKPYPADKMVMAEVSKKLNSSKNDSPDLLKPDKSLFEFE